MNGFRVVSRTEGEVPFRAREDPRDGRLIFRAADGFEVALPATVVDALHGLGRRAAPNEFLGLVYGTVLRDTIGKHMVVDGIVPVEGARATHSSVASTPSAAAAAEELAAELYPNSRRLGWCHSHPRYTTEFSTVDRRNQATYGPLGLGIVVDPWDERDHGVAVYRGPEATRLTLVGPTRSLDTGAAAEPAVRRRRADAGRSTRGPRALREGRAQWAALFLFVNLALSVAGVLVVSMRLAAHNRRLEQLERSASGAPSSALTPQTPAPVPAPETEADPPVVATLVCEEPEGP